MEKGFLQQYRESATRKVSLITGGFWAHFTCSYMNKIFDIEQSKRYGFDCLYEVADVLKHYKNNEFIQQIRERMNSGEQDISYGVSLFFYLKSKYLLYFLATFIASISSLFSPIIIKKYLEWIASYNGDYESGILLTLYLALTCLTPTITSQFTWNLIAEFVARVLLVNKVLINFIVGRHF